MNNKFKNIGLIKLNATFDESYLELNNSFHKLYSSNLKFSKISLALSSSDMLIKYFAQSIIFVFGGLQIIRGSLTLGQFTMIMAYFLMIMSSTSYFLSLGKSYQNALISLNRLEDILKEQKEINGTIQLKSISKIRLENISFKYSDVFVLKDFSCVFEQGKIYCITGENGSGKTTLINLLLGLYCDSVSGDVYYNEVNIQQVNLYYVRKSLISICEQEPILITKKLLDNVTYGLNQFDECYFSELQKVFNLHKLSENNSTKLSGGEKLKISLARALLKDPDILILDEPTSALDVASIKRLAHLISEIRRDKIVIIISHDEEMKMLADRIIELNGANSSSSVTINQERVSIV